MASVNKVILVGNLGRDPEMRTFPSGDQVANVTIATTDKWRDKTSGENREATEWHRVVFNGRLAEIAGQYLRKGSQVYVEGSIRTRKWTDPQSGQDRYATEIRADTLQMLGGRKDKIRPGDVLGALTAEAPGARNFTREQIGKITVTDQTTYVAVARELAGEAVRKLTTGKVKGRSVKVRALED